MTILSHNIGREGSLRFATDAIFDWGSMKAMGIMTKELMVEDITMKGEVSFKKEKNAILNHVSLSLVLL